MADEEVAVVKGGGCDGYYGLVGVKLDADDSEENMVSIRDWEAGGSYLVVLWLWLWNCNLFEWVVHFSRLSLNLLDSNGGRHCSG